MADVVEAMLYLRSPHGEQHGPPPGMADAASSANEFATQYGYKITARYQDSAATPLPGSDSPFAALLAHLDSGLARVVLVPSKTLLAPSESAQRLMGEMIDAHGGILIYVDSAAALVAKPPDPRRQRPQRSREATPVGDGAPLPV